MDRISVLINQIKVIIKISGAEIPLIRMVMWSADLDGFRDPGGSIVLNPVYFYNFYNVFRIGIHGRGTGETAAPFVNEIPVITSRRGIIPWEPEALDDRAVQGHHLHSCVGYFWITFLIMISFNTPVQVAFQVKDCAVRINIAIAYR